jgi:hypothetical protein
LPAPPANLDWRRKVKGNLKDQRAQEASDHLVPLLRSFVRSSSLSAVAFCCAISEKGCGEDTGKYYVPRSSSDAGAPDLRVNQIRTHTSHNLEEEQDLSYIYRVVSDQI